MGVRPPTDDDEEPDTIEFGIAALDARLDRVDLQFPATQEAVLQAAGDQSIPYDANGGTIALSTAMDETGKERFADEQELLNALHPVFEKHRTARSSSLLGQMRSLLPF